MITPNDIQEKDFARGVRGYKEDEVNSFLDLITLDMDKLIQENRVLKETINGLKDELERYKGSEGSIYETLESAKALMSDISASAEKRAEIVLKNAELEADRIQKDARESVERLHEEAAALTAKWSQFKTRYKNLLENEMERFEGLSADFLIDSEMMDFHALPESSEPKPHDVKLPTEKTIHPSESIHSSGESTNSITNTIKATKSEWGV